MLRHTLASLLLFAPFGVAFAQDKPKDKPADLPGYKTVKEAIKGDPKVFKATDATVPVKPKQSGFVGIEVTAQGRAKIEDIAPESPAEKAGLKAGDVITKIGTDAIDSGAAAKAVLRGLSADEKVTILVERASKAMEIGVTPKAVSKPLASSTSGPPPRLGISNSDVLKGGGVTIESVTRDGVADKAGIKEKDVLLQLDDAKIAEDDSISKFLGTKQAGDVVTALVKRGEKELKLKVTLASSQQGGRGGGWDDRLPTRSWSRPNYKLAVIGIEYPDQKHNPKIEDKDWEASLFSTGKYTDKSATGQRVYGSMADYYQAISYGQFKVEGSFVGWVEASKKRLEYQSGNGVGSQQKTALLGETLDKLLEKKGKDVLKDYDGVFFLFAGGRVNTTRGSLYWPHRANFRHKDKNWPYFIVQEGGDNMTNISVFCHEFGHMLGLPDLYARPEQPGMEGVGVWCAMSQQLPNGRPQHFSAWSKERLGWLKPTVIDPRVKQKLILSPIEDDNTQCFKVPLKADGGEYLLLENRRKKGWDTDLPAEGLLIWRVIPGNPTQQVFLEESHGIDGPSGPRSATGAVPFPSPANDSFTPFTTPSSKAQTGGGFDVYITNVRRQPDGRITFQIGYQYQ